MRVQVARWIERSRANGPGERFVLWVQGCPIRCPGCWNPDTWDPSGGQTVDAEELARVVLAVEGIEGITLTGGEPFVQAGGLLPFVRRVREAGLSVVAFSGFPLSRLLEAGNANAKEPRPDPAAPALLQLVDLQVAGPYDRARRANLPLRGSSNQRLYFLTNRYTFEDLEDAPELEIHLDGEHAALTGFPADTDEWLECIS